MKKNWIMWALGLGALYLFTKKGSTTTTTTTEDVGTPDLGNGGTPSVDKVIDVSDTPVFPKPKVDKVIDTTSNSGSGSSTPYVGTPPQNTEDRSKGIVYTM